MKTTPLWSISSNQLSSSQLRQTSDTVDPLHIRAPKCMYLSCIHAFPLLTSPTIWIRRPQSHHSVSGDTLLVVIRDEYSCQILSGDHCQVVGARAIVVRCWFQSDSITQHFCPAMISCTMFVFNNSPCEEDQFQTPPFWKFKHKIIPKTARCCTIGFLDSYPWKRQFHHGIKSCTTSNKKSQVVVHHSLKNTQKEPVSTECTVPRAKR